MISYGKRVTKVSKFYLFTYRKFWRIFGSLLNRTMNIAAKNFRKDLMAHRGDASCGSRVRF